MTQFNTLHIRSRRLITLAIFTTASLSACSSAPHPDTDTEFNAAKTAVSSFEQDVAKARSDQVDVLAPKNFSVAQDDLRDAKSEVANNADTKDVLKPLEAGKASLGVAKSEAEQNRTLAVELLNARTDAINADAARLTPDLWNKAEDRFKSQMKDQENSKNSSISDTDRKEILNRYILAQTSALKIQNLASLKEKVKTIENDNGEKLVPNALTETKNKISSAELTIDANRNDSASIQRATLAAQASYDHTKELYDRAKNVKSGSPEEVANTILKKDVRNQSLDHELNQTNESLAQTETEKKDLQTKTGTQAYIAGLQNRFDPSEAEVYQQGNSVLIRLKGMKFSSGRTDIPSQSTPLLEEVKQTIKELPTSSVMIEGHTDGIGSASKNQTLSQERADSIKKYLEADPSIKADRIYAKGYGFEKPLTTNKTAEGRAQNRRVDILIENISGAKQPTSSQQ